MITCGWLLHAFLHCYAVVNAHVGISVPARFTWALDVI
jgi:hypothetical protein